MSCDYCIGDIQCWDSPGRWCRGGFGLGASLLLVADFSSGIALIFFLFNLRIKFSVYELSKLPGSNCLPKTMENCVYYVFIWKEILFCSFTDPFSLDSTRVQTFLWLAASCKSKVVLGHTLTEKLKVSCLIKHGANINKLKKKIQLGSVTVWQGQRIQN